MDLSTLTGRPNGAKDRKRVGRGTGSGTGKTCGRGHKGQKSRAGYSTRFGFEGGQMPLHRRLPKRGFTHLARHPLAEVNLDVIETAFESGAEITAEILLEKGLAKRAKGGVKILGRGELTKPFTVRVHGVSEGARAKIEGAGGTVTVLEAPRARAAKPPRTRKSQEGK